MTGALRDRARGRWKSLLPQLGVDSRFLTGKHTACPICGDGKDRFRFDDKDGRGTWICSHCGAGDGIQLVMLMDGSDFRTAAERIETHVGKADFQPIKAGRSADDKRAALRRMWAASQPVRVADPVGLYLARRVGLQVVPPCLRHVERVRYQDDDPSWHPIMLAMVRSHAGEPVSLHRTYLTKAGAKAPVAAPRRLMEADLPKGSAIRLAEPGKVLGIAEGIETALSATALFGVPCWAAISDTILKGWEPPDGVGEIVIYGDHDRNFAGQSAAFALAHRIALRNRIVRVELPPLGMDWNDVLQTRIQEKQAA